MVFDHLQACAQQRLRARPPTGVVNLIRTRFWPSYTSGEPYPRNGNWLLTVPGNSYPCKPGGPNDYVYVFVLAESAREGCLRAMGRDDLIGDRRYQEIKPRLEHREEVEQMFAAWT